MATTFYFSIDQAHRLREELILLHDNYVQYHKAPGAWDESFPEIEEFYQSILNTISDYESL